MELRSVVRQNSQLLLQQHLRDKQVDNDANQEEDRPNQHTQTQNLALELALNTNLKHSGLSDSSLHGQVPVIEVYNSRRVQGLTNAATRSRPSHHKELGLSGDDSILGDINGLDLHDGVEFRRKRLEMSFDFFDAAALVFSMGSYLFDIITDITVAIFHYLNQDYWYCVLTVAFILLPSLITSIISMRWYIIDSKNEASEPVSAKTWIIRCMMHVLQIGPVLRYYQSLQYGLRFREAKSQEEKKKMYMNMIYEDADSAMLRVFEAFIEAAPQLLLQIKILDHRYLDDGLPFTDEDFWTTAAQLVSITTSLTSIAWALVIYRKSLRKSLPDKIPLSGFLPITFMFAFEFFSICARVIALSLLFSAPLAYHQIVIAILAHWLLMTFWVISMKTSFCETKWEERGWAALLGFILVFCFLNAVDKPTRRKYIAFYSLMTLESIPIMYISVFWQPVNKSGKIMNQDLRVGIVVLHYIFISATIVFMVIPSNKNYKIFGLRPVIANPPPHDCT